MLVIVVVMLMVFAMVMMTTTTQISQTLYLLGGFGCVPGCTVFQVVLLDFCWFCIIIVRTAIMTIALYMCLRLFAHGDPPFTISSYLPPIRSRSGRDSAILVSSSLSNS